MRVLFNSFWIVLFSLILISCGGESEEIDGAIDEANFLLTTRECSAARAVLDEVGYQASNPRYVGVYATTYACESSYSTVNFFADDLGNLSASANGFFGSLAAFSTSNLMTSATDPDFLILQQAIDTILYSGGVANSSSAGRIASFGLREATNLNVQALYMILVNFGRWLRYHGNANEAGSKGLGINPEGNTCLFSYTVGGPNWPSVQTALQTGFTGPCNDGAPNGTNDISTGDVAVNQERLCRGIVLFNNFVDIILNVNFTGNNTGDLNNLATTFNTLCQDVPQFSDALCDLRDMAGCQATPLEDLEVFSAWLFEQGFN